MPKPTEYQEAASARAIGERLINEHHPHLRGAVIAWLLRPAAENAEAKPPARSGKKIKIATASVFTAKNQAAVELLDVLSAAPDFVIEIKELYWDRLSLEQQAAVVDHELCHLRRDGDGWYLADHDVQEFRAVVERHGLYISDLEEFAFSIEQSRQLKLFPEEEPDQADREQANKLDEKKTGNGADRGMIGTAKKTGKQV